MRDFRFSTTTRQKIKNKSALLKGIKEYLSYTGSDCSHVIVITARVCGAHLHDRIHLFFQL